MYESSSRRASVLAASACSIAVCCSLLSLKLLDGTPVRPLLLTEPFPVSPRTQCVRTLDASLLRHGWTSNAIGGLSIGEHILRSANRAADLNEQRMPKLLARVRHSASTTAAKRGPAVPGLKRRHLQSALSLLSLLKGFGEQRNRRGHYRQDVPEVGAPGLLFGVVNGGQNGSGSLGVNGAWVLHDAGWCAKSGENRQAPR